ncbi:MAG TPA: rhodanese-like domain-containing protein [Methanotrichaceae archaeon]|nr:rhodanese-like domain-containing protein [Methanotrichaceae archaeon]
MNLQRAGAALVLVFILIGGANAACSSCGKATENWDPTAFLNSDITVPYGPGTNTGANNSTRSELVQPAYRVDPSLQSGLLRQIADLSSSDVVMDVSNDNSYFESHIQGAAYVPSRSFFNDNGTLKPAQEMAAILGQAGISREDSVVVYSDSLESGASTFAIWALEYLGQSNVRLLDGSFDDYSAAGLPVESGQSSRGEANYVPEVRPELLASFDVASGGSAQIVDARDFQDYGLGRIPGASFIDPSDVLDKGKIASSSYLNSTFAGLSKGSPVIVYSDDGVTASLVWYALSLIGYDSRLYTWNDWQAHGAAESAVQTGSNITRTGSKSKTIATSTLKSGTYKRLG